MTFTDFCTQFSLSSTIENPQQLQFIAQWCYQTVSQDIRYEGDEATQYSRYLNLAKNYLNAFIPNIPSKLSTKVALLDDMTAIHYAALHGYDRFIESQNALPPGALDIKNEHSMTALHLSAVNGFFHTVQTLLKKGANLRTFNAQNQSPLFSALLLPWDSDDALMRKKEAIFNVLISADPTLWLQKDISGDTVLHQMASAAYTELVSKAIAKAPQLLFICNHAQYYPIHTAILNQQSDIVELLLKIKGVESLEAPRKKSLLHFSVTYGTNNIVKHCIKACSNINVRDMEGNTPLLTAAIAGNIDFLDILIDAGADYLAADPNGYTIMHHAVLNNNNAMVQWLLNHTSSDLLTKCDLAGHPPIYYAQQQKNLELEQLMKQEEVTFKTRI